MSEWVSITEVREDQRQRFVDLALASAFETRTRLYAQDEVDAAELASMRLLYIEQFGRENAGNNDEATRLRFNDGLAQLALHAPLIRTEIENRPLDGWMWGLLGKDESIWLDGQCVHQSGQFYVIYSGLEFDVGKAERYGIRRLEVPSIPTEAAGKPRKLRGGWPDWIASVAMLASDGKIQGTLTETELLRLVAEDMAAKGQDEMSRSTVQPIAQAILARLRSEGI